MVHQGYLTAHSLTSKEIDRLFRNIEVDPITGCWNWTGQLLSNKTGYGQVTFRGRKELIHRVIYASRFGPIPRGRSGFIPVLDHVICSNRRCANPAHLSLVPDWINLYRSNSPAAVNRRKTHCIHGHVLPLPKRVMTTGKLMRTCIICKSLYDAKRSSRLPNLRDSLVAPSIHGSELVNQP